MNRGKTLRSIILPQALKVSIPPLSNSFIGLVKDTSLAASITIVEMFEVSQQIAAWLPWFTLSSVASSPGSRAGLKRQAAGIAKKARQKHENH